MSEGWIQRGEGLMSSPFGRTPSPDPRDEGNSRHLPVNANPRGGLNKTAHPTSIPIRATVDGHPPLHTTTLPEILF
jgi:hypothetical protein